MMQLGGAVHDFWCALQGEVAETTRENYRRRLRYLVRYFGEDRCLEALAVADLREWRSHLLERADRYGDHPNKPAQAGGLSPYTIHSCVQAARRFFAWCVEEELIPSNPARRLRLPRLPDNDPKGITKDDLEKLLVEAWESGERDYAIVIFLADTGCRVGGLCSLRVNDVDVTHRRATVREKGQKRRTVYFGAETARALGEWLSVRPDNKGDALFVGRRGPLQPNGVYQVLKRLAEGAGVAGRWNPHSFRHGAAISWLKNGVDLSSVSQLLGHRGILVTAHYYARWTTDELAKRHAQASRFDEHEK